MNREIDPIEQKLKALELAGKSLADQDKTACPSDESFGAFMEGNLKEEEAESIKQHIVQCATCHFAYRAWQETVPGEGPPVPARLLAKARSIVKPPVTQVVVKLLKNALELLNPSEILLAGAPEPSTVVTRSDEAGASPQAELLDLKSELAELDTIRVQILEDTDTVKIALFPSADESDERLARLRIEIYCGENLVQSWPLYREGTSMNPVERGSYRIEVKEIVSAGEQYRTLDIGSIALDLE